MLAEPIPIAPSFELVDERFETPVGSWRQVSALPRGPLSGLVEAVWASETDACFTNEAILPRTPTEVLFSLGDVHWLRDVDDPARDRGFDRAFVSGLQLAPLRVESPARGNMAGIRLKPAGVASFLGDTPALVAGQVVELDLLLGAGVERLRERVAEEPDLRRRVALLAQAVERRFESAEALPGELRRTLDRIHRTRGRVPIRRLVEDSGWSHRHFTARFRERFGRTPKSYARIVRFESAFARLQGMDRVHWAEFALESGFADQAHLVNEFRELAGATPTEVFRRLAPDGLGLLDEDDARPRG